ncbi:MAG: hypothetical protein JKX87_00915 [Cycloclasticus sp.]|nr:hypothetical protein [Cycloclasticus sp.]
MEQLYRFNETYDCTDAEGRAPKVDDAGAIAEHIPEIIQYFASWVPFSLVLFLVVLQIFLSAKETYTFCAFS